MKLEDLPKYIPLIRFIDNKDNSSQMRLFGDNSHDTLVIEDNKNYLYYYNSQCGESSHECSDFRFSNEAPTCHDDDFYSRWCKMVNLEELIKDHDKEVCKQVCDEIREKLGYVDLYAETCECECMQSYNMGFDTKQVEIILDQIEKGEI